MPYANNKDTEQPRSLISTFVIRYLGITVNEPSHEIIALFVLRKLILQTCMHSHSVGLDIWFLVGPFVYFHTACVWTAKAPARLHKCANLPEPSLVAYAISTVISWAGSNHFIFACSLFRDFLISKLFTSLGSIIHAVSHFLSWESVVSVRHPNSESLVSVGRQLNRIEKNMCPTNNRSLLCLDFQFYCIFVWLRIFPTSLICVTALCYIIIARLSTKWLSSLCEF